MVQFILKDPVATARLLQDQGVTTLEELRSRCHVVDATHAPSRKKARTGASATGKKWEFTNVLTQKQYVCWTFSFVKST